MRFVKGLKITIVAVSGAMGASVMLFVVLIWAGFLAIGWQFDGQSPIGFSRSEVMPPLAAVFAGWYGFDHSTGECAGGLGSTHWNDGPETGGVQYTPYKEFYCSADSKVVSWQIDQMERAGITVLLYSWWGWGDSDLDGVLEGHPDQWINRGVEELLRQLDARDSDIQVAIIVEPFTWTQAKLEPQDLSNGQRKSVLDFLWETYYAGYHEQMFSWDGKPLIVVFDPMRLVDDERFTIRHWSGRPRSEQTIEQGWDWNFGPPQSVVDGMSRDGVVFVYPRFDETYLARDGATYLGGVSREIDPLLTEGVYEQNWRSLRKERGRVRMIVLYSWNLYGEQAHIEPSTGEPAPVESDYVLKTRRYYSQFLGGS